MKVNHILMFTTALGLLCGCNSTIISVTQNQHYDFSTIKTYQWVDASDKVQQEGDGHLNATARHALNNELSARGLKEVLQPEKADVQICGYVQIKTHEEYADSPPEDGNRVGGGIVFNNNDQKWHINDGKPNIHAYTIETGILTLEVNRTPYGTSLWKGSLQTELDRTRPTIKQNERIHRAARDLMRSFPIGID